MLSLYDEFQTILPTLRRIQKKEYSDGNEAEYNGMKSKLAWLLKSRANLFSDFGREYGGTERKNKLHLQLGLSGTWRNREEK